VTKIHTGMALAAGLGTRMRPLTNDRPKALVELGGKTLLDWALARYAETGVERAVVNVHHFADQVDAHLKSQALPLPVRVSDERECVLETGGGVVKALPMLGEDPIFVSNIDAVWQDTQTSELDRMRAVWDGSRMDVLLLLAPMEDTLGFDGPGDFFIDEEGRVAWRADAPRAPFAYAGVQILEPSILANRVVERFSMVDVWKTLVPKGRVFGLPMKSFWMHVGDPQARDAAQARLTG
jgi:MurNAc alpha-1-phosphate uridylyltransferase